MRSFFVFAAAVFVAFLSVVSVSAQEEISWTTQADSLRGRNGQHVNYLCPPGSPVGRLWGTNIYTDDSSICTAAVHAGRIRAENGGAVTIEVRPGAGSYHGSTRHGATSKSYGHWHGSFIFVSSTGDAGASALVVTGHQRGNDDQSSNAAQQISWSTQATSLRGKNGQRVIYLCPAGGSYSGRLWGTGTYTDDSSICLAAVHAGIITPETGGRFTIEIRSGASSYQGSNRNGVKSNGYGSWHGSFVVLR